MGLCLYQYNVNVTLKHMLLRNKKRWNGCSCLKLQFGIDFSVYTYLIVILFTTTRY